MKILSVIDRLRVRARAGRVAAAVASLLAVASVSMSAPAVQDGQWLINSTRDPARVQLTLMLRSTPGHDHWTGSSLPLARLQGLSREDLDARSADVHFEIHRDAGTFLCQGRSGGGRGAGLFELQLAPDFPRELERRGVAGTLSESQQTRLAFADAGYALLEALEAQHYPTPNVTQLVTMADHGVDLEYVTGMAALGFKVQSLEILVETRDHGVDPDYVRGMQEAGYSGLALRQLVSTRDHGVDPAYVRGMAAGGFTGLTLSELVDARDHGVDPDYAAQMRGLGHRDMSLPELVELRNHGVDADYARGMAAAGHAGMPLAQLLVSRDHGVDPQYVRSMAAAGYSDLSIPDLIRARDHGVDGAFARQVKAKVGKVSLDRLIRIRDGGGMDD